MGGVHSHLAARLRLLEARHARVEHEAQDLAVGGGVALVELADEDDGVGVGAVGDEGLRAVEHVLVAVALGGGLHRAEGVGARVGLGDAHDPIFSMVSNGSRAHRSFWAVVPLDMIAEAVRPTLTPMAVTIPGQ